VANKKKAIHRKKIGLSVDPDLWEKINEISEEQNTPASRLIDEGMKVVIKRAGKD
jgi:hypothetical protein